MEEEKKIDLTLRNCVSENSYRKKIGKDNFLALDTKTKNLANGQCESCKLSPKTEVLVHKHLWTHIVEENLDDPINTQTLCLCLACHITQHIETAIKNDWIELVNSFFSQGTLTNMCRKNNNGLIEAITSKKIVKLKERTPENFLKELKSGVINYDNRLKITFKAGKFIFKDENV